MGSTGHTLLGFIAAVLQAPPIRRTPLILHAAALSQALPVIAALRHGRRLPAERLWTVAWCVALMVGDGFQLWLRGSNGTNNLWLRAAGAPIQNAIMLWTLSLWQRHAVSRLAFRIAIPLFLVTLVALIPTVGETRTFDTVTGPFQALMLLASALYTLVRNAASDPEGVTRHDWFWVTLGVSLYFGLRVALPPFAAMLMSSHLELVRLAYFVQASADIATFLLIARGIWCPLPQARSGGFF
jgi:hypothetical protein